MALSRRAILAAAWLAVLPLAPVAARGAEDPFAPVLFLEGVPEGSGLAGLLRTETLAAHEEMRQWFGVRFARPITVVWLADGAELLRRTGSEAGTIAGAARPDRGEVLLWAPALMSKPQRIAAVLRHEVCHLVFAQATRGAQVEPPRWLDEGVATWRSGEWDLDLAPQRDQFSWIRDAAAAGHLFSLDDLDGTFPSGARMPLAYAQSTSFVEWLVRRHGEDALRRFLREIDRDQDPDPAARAAFGEGLPALEAEWRADVVPGGALGRLPSAAALASAAWAILGVLLVAGWVKRRLRLRRLAAGDEVGPALPGGADEAPPGRPPADSREP